MNYDILIPSCISVGVFIVSILVWKLAVKARWPYVIVNSYSIAIIPLFILRKFKKDDCAYVIDLFSVVEAILFILAIVSMLSLNTYAGCIANPRRQCCYTLRLKKDMNAPYLYDDSMFDSNSVDNI
jgi:hypothetical protein